ncbi:nucleoside triphosphate pyrophosphohydrolase MazG [Psychroflexus torquis ATCC 700755]|uniref:Nucleoside triphosphate pyrophosphohydrolase n=1 Tax=Psychroflexus torquis (strain ATCC 700755 / CIP 106069 / ACAM 623) TaxID=313595 RepID=K4IJ88_PSYTT|nr:nucleoside triphosphate pyrophosphohydrolase [Psychroflexus torquis]AFU69888.1 nucleoside triphosphate pyrophosphohydrolase MazG [Psychroflexus torquis ATCC 700755]
MYTRQKQLKAFENLLDMMDELREKCPWDRKQTMESLRNLTVEEVYELGDAILENDKVEIKKELGDVLLHIVFYSKIASETEDFDITDVIDSLCKKMVNRHPHIYGDTKVENEKQVKENWEKIKLKEGNKSVLQGVPKSLPALIKASRIQDKVAGVGFDWEEPSQVFEKVQEELGELQEEVKANDLNKIEDEFGDVLFSMINYARFLKIDPETALERTNKKFIFRFQHLEKRAGEHNLDLSTMSLEEMDKFWEEAKHL